MNFIQTVVRREKSSLFATFDDQVYPATRLHRSARVVGSRSFAVKKTGEKTALVRRHLQFCDQKMRSAQGRRSLVVITDGDDTYSRADINDASTLRSERRQQFSQSPPRQACPAPYRRRIGSGEGQRRQRPRSALAQKPGEWLFSPAICWRCERFSPK